MTKLVTHCQGIGRYTWGNGGYYEGEWMDNKRNGRGKEVWTSGSVYDGLWKEYDCMSTLICDTFCSDEMHGWGRKVCTRDSLPDGIYEGPFLNGRANGMHY